eukprot:scaffold372856_cov34-Prasinocladus_malaysianus.AAC.1
MGKCLLSSVAQSAACVLTLARLCHVFESEAKCICYFSLACCPPSPDTCGRILYDAAHAAWCQCCGAEEVSSTNNSRWQQLLSANFGAKQWLEGDVLGSHSSSYV